MLALIVIREAISALVAPSAARRAISSSWANDFPVGERIAAYEALAAGEGGVSCVEEEMPEDRIWKRVELWRLGPVTLFDTQGTGTRVTRSLRQAWREAVDTVAITIHYRGTGGFAHTDHQQRI